MVSVCRGLCVLLSSATVALVYAQPSVANPRDDAGSLGSSQWKVVAPSTTDVYVDMGGNVLPKDAAGMPMDNPMGYESTEVTPGEAGIASAEDGALSTAIGGCTPVSGRDYPHRSSTGIAASGHGWWGKGTCSNNTAKVYNCLYMRHSDGYWYQKDCSDVETLKPGTGGSSARTTARRNCATTTSSQWRNHVDVDVIGEWDTAEMPMVENSVACRA